MAVPTTASRGDSVAGEAEALHQTIAHARQLAVTWQTTLLSDVEIESLINSLYIPFAASADRNGAWHLIEQTRGLARFHEHFLSPVGLWFEFGPADVLLPGNRIVPGENSFAVDDKVRFRSRDTLPAPLAEGTDYWVNSKPTAQALTLRATEGAGADIDITSKGAGDNVIRYAINADLNALETALEGVVDAIIAAVPTDNPTPHILGRQFDKLLASGTTGLAESVLTPAATSSIRTALATLQSSIEAPV